MDLQEQWELEKKLISRKLINRKTKLTIEFYDVVKNEKDENLRLLKLKRIDLEIQSIERQLEELRQEKFYNI